MAGTLFFCDGGGGGLWLVVGARVKRQKVKIFADPGDAEIGSPKAAGSHQAFTHFGGRKS
jgi:hypothetical protein